MTGKKFRVWSADSAPGEAADCLRALYPGPHSTLELSIVSDAADACGDDRTGSTGAMFYIPGPKRRLYGQGW
jgi:hypothetical protein